MRRSLAASYESKPQQVARFLKEQVHNGVWKERLPGERTLAIQLDVGRDTLRAALNLLEKDGLILERSRDGTRLRPQATPSQLASASVGVLLLMPLATTTYRTLHWLDEFRRMLYQQNIQMEIYDGYVKKRRMLPTLLTQAHHDCWVLAYPTKKALQWALSNQLPSVVVGTVDKSIPLPSVDIHYRALCRHAVGQMLQQGHRHLALLLHRREWGADLESVRGFEEGVRNAIHPGVTALVDYHNGTPAGIGKLVDRTLARTPQPTAWIIAVAPHFLNVMTHLLRRHIDIPGQISLISQDAEPWQFFSEPQPTRYEADVAMLARQTTRAVQRVISGQRTFSRPTRVIPRLLPGATLGPPPTLPDA